MIAILLCIYFLKKYNFIDDPNKRKHPAAIHTKPIPRGGGLPLFLGVLVNTFFPKFLEIGGFTTALFGPKASSTILACFMFLIGSQINFKLAPKALKKGALLITGKFIVGAGIGIFVGKVFGPAGVLGLSPLAILAALTNCNGGLYASLACKFRINMHNL